MSVTLIGFVVLAIGLFVFLLGDMATMLGFTLVTTMFGGSAAILLGASGKASSIPPANLALLFIVARAVLPGQGQVAHLGAALRANLFLVLFALYAVIGAWFLPRIFAGAAAVTPLHPGAVKQLAQVAPIRFSVQNITTAIYMIGTMIAGVCAFIGAARPRGDVVVVRIGIIIAIAHALLGFLSIAVAQTPLDGLIEFFRNGNYAQLDQSFGEISRMSGIWPEASGFSAYGGAWLIFMVELWLRDVRPRWTGLAALLLASALLISTSSTAYVTLGGYSVVFALRTILLPWTLPLRKAISLAGAILVAGILLLAMLLVMPRLINEFSHIIALMTVDKTASYSGQQRALWARQGLDAFLVSRGLGIGAGSFRSSSLIMAILGSTGVIGVGCFGAHLVRAWKPWRASTYFGVSGDRTAVAAAAGWAALLMLMPAAVSSPSPDPGLVWGMFCGFALALRPAAPVSRSPGLARYPVAVGAAFRSPPLVAGQMSR